MELTSDAQNGKDGKCPLSAIAPLETVLFDIDGTLCESEPLHYLAFLEMLPTIGFNDGVPITQEFYVENFSGKHNSEIEDSLFTKDHDKEVKIKFMDDIEATFRKLAARQLKAVKGLSKLCEWIKDRGYKLAAVTNAPRENAELILNILGLTDFFQVLVIGNECERPKPFPDPYLKALEILGASAAHAFIFEDSVSGITAGVAAGMPVVGLTTGNPENLLVQANPAFLIKDYEDPKLWTALEELGSLAGATETNT